MTTPLIVRDTSCGLRIPLVLSGCDGDRPVPAGGILLLRVALGEGTRFPDREAAEAAIERTLEHGARYRYPWRAEDFEVQTVMEYEAERQPRRRGKKVKSEEAEA